MNDVLAAKRALARLADPSPVRTAERALRDLDRAARFRDAGGLARLRRVVDRADGRRARRARAALVAFERFERAAAGEALASPPETHRGLRRRPGDGVHFRRGHDTHLGDGG